MPRRTSDGKLVYRIAVRGRWNVVPCHARTCRAPMVYVRGSKGGKVPLDYARRVQVVEACASCKGAGCRECRGTGEVEILEMEAHFAHCPERQAFRRATATDLARKRRGGVE